jgi:hypothetical protein
MLSWLKSQRERWMKRWEERRAGNAERTLRRNEANALRRRNDHMDGPNGPMSGPGI